MAIFLTDKGQFSGGSNPNLTHPISPVPSDPSVSRRSSYQCDRRESVQTEINENFGAFLTVPISHTRDSGVNAQRRLDLFCGENLVKRLDDVIGEPVLTTTMPLPSEDFFIPSEDDGCRIQNVESPGSEHNELDSFINRSDSIDRSSLKQHHIDLVIEDENSSSATNDDEYTQKLASLGWLDTLLDEEESVSARFLTHEDYRQLRKPSVVQNLVFAPSFLPAVTENDEVGSVPKEDHDELTPGTLRRSRFVNLNSQSQSFEVHFDRGDLGDELNTFGIELQQIEANPSSQCVRVSPKVKLDQEGTDSMLKMTKVCPFVSNSLIVKPDILPKIIIQDQ